MRGSGTVRIGTVKELWRYPVKSMRGESLTELAFDAAGVVGDRRFALVSTAAPTGKPLLSSRERTAMLRYQPRLRERPEVEMPDGRVLPLLSPALLEELQTQLAADSSSTLRATLRMEESPAQPLTDVRPVALVSEATLRGLEAELGRFVDPQRFRSNLIVALEDDRPFAEDTLAGKLLQFGEGGALLRVQERIPRCRIVSLDPETAEADPELLRHLAQQHGGRVGIYASVVRVGTVRVGDGVSE